MRSRGLWAGRAFAVLLEPPSPLSTTLPDSTEATENADMGPRKIPEVPSFLTVESSDAEKARAYANLAIALHQTLPGLVEKVDYQGGVILACNGLTTTLVSKVSELETLIRSGLAAERQAVVKGRAIAALPSMSPPPQVLELDEEPTNHGQHATVKISTLENARTQFSQVDQDKRAALAAVKILQDEREENNRKLRERYTAWGIAAVPVIMVLFWAFEHLVFKAN